MNLQRIIRSLRFKLFLPIMSAFLILITTNWFLFKQTALHEFAQIEEKQMQNDMDRINNALQGTLRELDSTLHSWSSWDDTVDFIENHSEEYIKANTIDDLFNQYNLNAMLFYDQTGKLRFSKFFDLVQQTSKPTPDEVLNYFIEHKSVLQNLNEKSYTVGIIPLTSQPLLIAIRPILDSQGLGPQRGTIIFGRYLDQAKIAELTQITKLAAFTLYRLDATNDTKELQLARTQLQAGQQVVAIPTSDTTIVGYLRLNDLTNVPRWMLRLEEPRPLYAQGLQLSRHLTTLLSVGAVLAVGISLVVLEILVLSRLFRMETRVAQLGASGLGGERVLLSGNDELTQLGRSINAMLATQEQAQVERIELEQARIRSLEETAQEQRRLVAELEASLATQQRLSQTVQALAVPIIPVLPATIVVPLVGVFDSVRSQQLHKDLLSVIEKKHIRYNILDMTGLTMLDRVVAQELRQLISAIRLLGAEAILVGIRPEVAETLVQQDVSLMEYHVAANLQTAVMTIVARMQ